MIMNLRTLIAVLNELPSEEQLRLVWRGTTLQITFLTPDGEVAEYLPPSKPNSTRSFVSAAAQVMTTPVITLATDFTKEKE